MGQVWTQRVSIFIGSDSCPDPVTAPSSFTSDSPQLIAPWCTRAPAGEERFVYGGRSRAPNARDELRLSEDEPAEGDGYALDASAAAAALRPCVGKTGQ